MEIFKILVLLLSLSCFCQAQLSPNFYNQTCPEVFSIVRQNVQRAIFQERRMGASLLRLHFLDCFVGGCDASILLSRSFGWDPESESPATFGSARGFDVIDQAKSDVDNSCGGTVSCADIIALAAREVVQSLGGPNYEVLLGRRDSTEAYGDLADIELPYFNASLDALSDLFERKGLNTRDLVALSGAHTLGVAQCFTFRDRLYDSSSDIDAGLATIRKLTCPASGGDSNLAPLDDVTPNIFDNIYYVNLMLKRGLLATDQMLYGTGASTDSIVSEYALNLTKFRSDFGDAMIKMGNINPLTGSAGQIRQISCSRVL